MSLTITIYNISFMQSPESSQFLLQKSPLLFFSFTKANMIHLEEFEIFQNIQNLSFL